MRKYQQNLGKWMEQHFGVTEFWHAGRWIAKSSAGVWLETVKEPLGLTNK